MKTLIFETKGEMENKVTWLPVFFVHIRLNNRVNLKGFNMFPVGLGLTESDLK